MIRATLTAALVGLVMSSTLATPGYTQTEYDSAGVTVVRNPPAVETVPGWTIGPEPLIEIGGAADDARYQLFQVVDAARLSDGRIVVADGSSHELRFYDERGAYVSATGRQGEGPGEFRGISGLEVGGDDSIYVFDRSSRRVSIFDARGGFARDIGVPLALAPFTYVGRFADARWYARSDGPFDPATSGASRREIVRYIALDAALERDSLIAKLAGEIWVAFRAFGDVGYRTALFTPSPSQDVHGSCLYVVAGDDFDVSVFSSDGRLIRLVRNAGERQPVTEAHRSAWIKDFIDNLPAEVPEALRAQLPNELKKIPTAERLPVYNDLVVDARGYIWIQEYHPQSESGRSWSGAGRSWIVLDPTGKSLGRVEMPAALDVYEIGADYVLGRWQDEIGEEFVRLYRLRAARDPDSRPPGQCTELHGT
jgi:hypothetical protein